jgi:uncharacterized protein
MKNPYVRIIFSIVVNLVLSILLVQLVLPMIGIKDIHSNPYYLGTYGSLVSLIVTGVILLIFKKIDKKPIKSMGFSINVKSIFFMITTGIFMVGTTLLFLTVFNVDFRINTEFLSKPSNYFIVLFSIIGWFFAALHEEIAGRGYFYSNLQKYGYTKLLLISSLIFMIMHFPMVGPNPYALLDFFLVGLCYMFIYIKSGSIWVATFVHAANNFIMYFTFSEMPFSIVKIPNTLPDIYSIYYGVLIYVGLTLISYVFYGQKNHQNHSDEASINSM